MADRTCLVCGNKYKYCPTCEKYSRLPKWMLSYDKENCKRIFDVASLFCQELISQEEAKQSLSDLDLSVVTKVSLKKVLKDILNDPSETTDVKKL